MYIFGHATRRYVNLTYLMYILWTYYIHVHKYTCVFVDMYMCGHVTCVFVDMCICGNVYLWTCIYVDMSHVYMWTCHLCICVHVANICGYVPCIYIYGHVTCVFVGMYIIMWTCHMCISGHVYMWTYLMYIYGLVTCIFVDMPQVSLWTSHMSHVTCSCDLWTCNMPIVYIS